MFKFIKQINNMLNLFHKEIYEMFSAREKTTAINTILNIIVVCLNSMNIEKLEIKEEIGSKMLISSFVYI